MAIQSFFANRIFNVIFQFKALFYYKLSLLKYCIKHNFFSGFYYSQTFKTNPKNEPKDVLKILFHFISKLTYKYM